jgi:myo-inositol 2-dehydrogenase/D-chiro-inositol 1-dehydrogenase
MRIGVLGTGRIGSYRAMWFGAHPEVEQVLVGSREAARARGLAERVGGVALSYEEVLDSAPDGVVISTATCDHAPLVAACAERGLPIFCEKPVAPTLAETEATLAAVERAGVVMQVAFQRRLDPGWRATRELVEGGGLGVLYSIHITSHDHEPSPPEYIPTSGGIFRDLHVHDFDIARWVTGEQVESVYALGAVRHWQRFAEHGDVDTSAVVLTMETGLPVLVSGARHDPRGYDCRAEIFGSEDSVAVGWDARTPLRSLEPGAAPPGPDPYRGFLDRFEAAFRAEMDAFLDLVAGRGENPCPGSASLEALRVAIACDASRAEGRPVRVREVSDA